MKHVMKFWAPWCATCKSEGTRVDLITDHYQARLHEYNVEHNADHAQMFNVKNLPTYVIMEDNEENLWEEVGRAYNVRDLEDQLEKLQ